ncbi:hypothetical protein LUW77_25370 [Streptomyces radiopugnans]|nr:hypothetical protein LUW77_25370 [Streptomyces radiopugnans]
MTPADLVPPGLPVVRTVSGYPGGPEWLGLAARPDRGVGRAVGAGAR